MGYTTYNRSLYRTGFRPYGQTNAWAASQLNGMDTGEAVLSGYLGQSNPFTERGGWGLHGSASFHPWTLKGAPICLDQNENTVPCTDPECTFGDCGSTDAQVSSGPLCLDETENAVACGDPGCKYGDCNAPSVGRSVKLPLVGTVYLPPGPSPRVGVPASTMPSTSPQSWTKSSLIQGVPDLVVYGFGALALVSVLSSSGRRRR